MDLPFRFRQPAEYFETALFDFRLKATPFDQATDLAPSPLGLSLGSHDMEVCSLDTVRGPFRDFDAVVEPGNFFEFRFEFFRGKPEVEQRCYNHIPTDAGNHVGVRNTHRA